MPPLYTTLRTVDSNLFFVSVVNLVQSIGSEAGEYPPGSKNRQGVRSWHIRDRLKFPSVRHFDRSVGPVRSSAPEPPDWPIASREDQRRQECRCYYLEPSARN